MKRITSCLLICLLIIGSFTTLPASAAEYNKDRRTGSNLSDNYYPDYEYVLLDDNTAKLTMYQNILCGIVYVIVPDSLDGHTVTEIETIAFLFNKDIMKLVLQDGVKIIRRYAASGCSNLQSVTIPDTVTTIEEGAFYGCTSISAVYIPPTVTSIGELAFGYYSDVENHIDDIKVNDLTIIGSKGSEAERYANANGFTFEASESRVGIPVHQVSRGTNCPSASDNNDDYDDEHIYNEGYKNPVVHSKKDILEYAQKEDILSDINAPICYDEEPLLEYPYSAGKLSDSTLKSALNTLNFMRYIAGIDYHVVLNENVAEAVQTGALINRVNEVLDHRPSRPEDMDSDMFSIGYSGTSSSNLGNGYSDLGDAIINGWLDDGGVKNIGVVGHRRWALYPPTQYTNFGYVDGYCGMYAFGYKGSYSNPDLEYKNIKWPAENMPVEFFGSSNQWSLCTGNRENVEKIKVTLTCKNTGQQWTITNRTGMLFVDDNCYGDKGCIVFIPETQYYRPGVSYNVLVEGTREGNISYDVNFFSIKDNPEDIDDTPNTQVVDNPEGKLPGDINGDGYVDMKDITRLQKFINQWDVEIVEQNSDVNGDGDIGMKDIILLQKYINKWDVVLK